MNDFLSNFFNFLRIERLYQCLSITSSIFGNVLLKETTSGKFSWVPKFKLIAPFDKISLRSLKCLITSQVSGQISFIRYASLNGIISFKDVACAKS